jgi:hypothetical protein
VAPPEPVPAGGCWCTGCVSNGVRSRTLPRNWGSPGSARSGGWPASTPRARPACMIGPAVRTTPRPAPRPRSSSGSWPPGGCTAAARSGWPAPPTMVYEAKRVTTVFVSALMCVATHGHRDGGRSGLIGLNRVRLGPSHPVKYGSRGRSSPSPCRDVHRPAPAAAPPPPTRTALGPPPIHPCLPARARGCSSMSRSPDASHPTSAAAAASSSGSRATSSRSGSFAAAMGPALWPSRSWRCGGAVGVGAHSCTPTRLPLWWSCTPHPADSASMRRGPGRCAGIRALAFREAQ